MNTTHAMSTHPPHMKNSPSAFIPFCEYNEDMLAVGEHMDGFPFPVCNAFIPSVIEGQLCYTFTPSNARTTDTAINPVLMFLLDYNEDREYSNLMQDDADNDNEPDSLGEMDKNNDRNSEAMIYIHTIGKVNFIKYQHHYKQ